VTLTVQRFRGGSTVSWRFPLVSAAYWIRL
jgi:hypothetical protein